MRITYPTDFDVSPAGEDRVEFSITKELDSIIEPGDKFEPGSYQVELEVTDSGGETVTETITFVLEKKDSDDGDEGFFESQTNMFTVIGSSAVLVVLIGAFLVSRKGEAGTGAKGRESDSNPEASRDCPECGGETQYSEDEDDYYCWECGEYAGEIG